MSKREIFAGDTSKQTEVYLVDASGAPLPALAFGTAGLIAYYTRKAAAPAAITLVTQTVTGAYSSGGFIAKDATHMPGLYRFDPPDACFATGSPNVIIQFSGAGVMTPPMEIELPVVNKFDGVRFGMTALPNAAAEAAGGLFTRGTGAGQINQDANGRIDGNLAAISGSTTNLANFVAMLATSVIGTVSTAVNAGSATNIRCADLGSLAAHILESKQVFVQTGAQQYMWWGTVSTHVVTTSEANLTLSPGSKIATALASGVKIYLV